MNVHEYKAIQSETERNKYIEEAQGESFAERYRKTSLYSNTYEDVMAQVEECLEYEKVVVEEEGEDLSYPTSIFTQVQCCHQPYLSC